MASGTLVVIGLGNVVVDGMLIIPVSIKPVLSKQDPGLCLNIKTLFPAVGFTL